MRTDKPITLLLRVVCSFVCACVHVLRSVSVGRTLHIGGPASHRVIILYRIARRRRRCGYVQILLYERIILYTFAYNIIETTIYNTIFSLARRVHGCPVSLFGVFGVCASPTRRRRAPVAAAGASSTAAAGDAV